jgi:hypothetical protein
MKKLFERVPSDGDFARMGICEGIWDLGEVPSDGDLADGDLADGDLGDLRKSTLGGDLGGFAEKYPRRGFGKVPSEGIWKSTLGGDLRRGFADPRRRDW